MNRAAKQARVRRRACCGAIGAAMSLGLLAWLGLVGPAGARFAPTVLDPEAFESIAQANHRAVVRIDTTQYFSSEVAQNVREVADSPSYLGVAGRSLALVALLPFKTMWQGLSLVLHPTELPSAHSVGSGFIVDPGGEVLTANHVVEGADRITIDVPEVGDFPGVVLGRDRETDLALLKILTDAPIRFDAVTLGDSDAVKAGQFVMVMGSPLGLQQSVSAGVVSAVGLLGAGFRSADMIQHDAGLNPGSSGGPLFDLSGRVIGVNSSIAAQGQDIGFATPIAVARNELDDLRAGVNHQRSYLGITFEPISVETMHRYGVRSERGARLTVVATQSPAEAAGLREGDVILALGATKIEKGEDLFRAIIRSRPNCPESVEIIRDGELKKLEITPARRPEKRTLW